MKVDNTEMSVTVPTSWQSAASTPLVDLGRYADWAELLGGEPGAFRGGARAEMSGATFIFLARHLSVDIPYEANEILTELDLPTVAIRPMPRGKVLLIPKSGWPRGRLTVF